MSIFRKHKHKGSVPADCLGLEVRIESSTCTGEKTIGFYDPDSRQLKYSELVRSQTDIDSFCEKYGVDLSE